MQLVCGMCTLFRVYLRNPLDPPDISGFERDSEKDKRKWTILVRVHLSLEFNVDWVTIYHLRASFLQYGVWSDINSE